MSSFKGMAKEKKLAGSGAYFPTNEDWAPSFAAPGVSVEQEARGGGGLLCVNFFPLAPSAHPRKWRVSVWGADDTGMERDVETEEQAWALWRRIPVPVTRGALVALGFRTA